ncbi:hypothetical protein [Mycolicibacterium sp. HK-90]|uniref:hypothetical protein n=1 Tax=Mycolicibacterium sp. HK-90 TaxID=3056937 RepID=UPI002657B0C4|nr:hypothetical protein [Mycolicibacterium sp. HK-90]WKG03642.1 hypothetical protein QU592_00365 [Mycolicibacterium sp. HK-90]
MLDVLLVALENFILNPIRPSVFEGNLRKTLVVDVLTRFLHSLRNRVNQVFRVSDLLLDEFQLAFDPLGRRLTQFVSTNNSRGLIEGGLRARTFPMVRQSHSLPASLRNYLIPQGCCQRTERVGGRTNRIFIGIRPCSTDYCLSTVFTRIRLFRIHWSYPPLRFQRRIAALSTPLLQCPASSRNHTRSATCNIYKVFVR